MSSTAKLKKAHVAFMKTLEDNAVVRIKKTKDNSYEDRAFKKSARSAIGLGSK